MVAETSASSAGTSGGASETPQERERFARIPPIRARSGTKRLFVSLYRLVNLQSRIILLRAKFTVAKIVLGAALGMAAAVVSLLGVIFLYIGIFDALCLVMRPVFAWLIFAAVHLVSAVVLAFLAKNAFQAKLGGDKKNDQHHHTPASKVGAAS